jgi:hypothetical protein
MRLLSIALQVQDVEAIAMFVALFTSLTPKILSNQIWVASYFGQPHILSFLALTFCVTP